MPLLILQAKAPLEPRDDRTLVAIQQIKNLRYFQLRPSEELEVSSTTRMAFCRFREVRVRPESAATGSTG